MSALTDPDGAHPLEPRTQQRWPRRGGPIRYSRLPLTNILLSAAVSPLWLLPLLVFAPPLNWLSLIIPGAVLLWRTGATFDLEKQTVTLWSGPFVPLLWSRHRLRDYDAVSIVTDTFETYPQHRSLYSGRRFGEETHVKLVARLRPEHRFHDDLPEPLVIPMPTLAGFRRRKRSLREEAQSLAESLGFDFMDVR